MVVVTLLSGCNYFQGSSSDADDEFADLELDDDADRVPVAPKLASSVDSAAPEDLLPAEGELGLQLSVGDRFPLKKTLEQKLTQAGENGPVTGHSRLDLLMSLAVEELRDGQTRLGVRYHSVRYREQDLEGRTVDYNSLEPGEAIPPQAQVYAGMVNNGFSFWIGPDNRLVDLVGFKDFVQRCLRDVPPEQRQSVITQLSADGGENGIASFIDDSIGLLPVSGNPKSSRVAVQEGTTWNLPVRKIDGPVPMQVATTCKIKGLSERQAEIDLFGSIAPGSPMERQHGWKVTLLGGRCLGSCTVDRQTGIPTNSVVQRYVDLKLETPDGAEVKQRKEIVTTITAFLNQEGGPSVGQVTPAAHEVDAGSSAEAEKGASAKQRRPIKDDLRLFR